MDIHSAKDKNLVNLANISWRLLTNTQTPWAKTIIGLHGSRNNLRSPSFIWNIIIHDWNICNKGITWLPNKMSSLSVWNSQWLFKMSSLRQCINGPLTQADVNLTIRDIWVNNKWDLSKLSKTLSITLTNKVIVVTPNTNNFDIPIWSLNTNGLLLQSFVTN